MKTITIGMIPEPDTAKQMRAALPAIESIDAILAIRCATDDVRSLGVHVAPFEAALEIHWRRNRRGTNHRAVICIDAGTGRVRRIPQNSYAVDLDGQPLTAAQWTDLVWAYIGVLEVDGSLGTTFQTAEGEMTVRRITDLTTEEPE